MEKRVFGRLPDGSEVEEYFLHSDKISASVITYGASLRTLFVGGRDIVGGYETLEEYLSDKAPYQGAIIGRVCGRTRGAQFTLGEKTYHLTKNNGENHLHGGVKGFHRRLWHAVEADSTHVTLSRLSPDGEEGYPANLAVRVTYTVEDDALFITYDAESDGDTPISLTNHAFYNLGGLDSGDVFDYTVQIFADRYTELDASLVSTGNRLPVEGTPFDFRTPKKIHTHLSPTLEGYDHNFIFSDAPVHPLCGMQLPHVASISGHGITMEVYTTSPCAQFYTGNFLGGEPRFKGGIEKQKHHALCFETQFEPDNIHHGGEPLHAGEKYHTLTAYRFLCNICP